MRHLDCNHPTTPGAREACRMLHRLIAAATRRELEIEWVTPPDEECAGLICQVWIKNPRRSLDPCMLVTCSRGTPIVAIIHVTSSERVSWRQAFIWLDIIRI